MAIRITNDSASVVLNGYAYTDEGLVVWLDIAPQHQKTVGAIRAELTSNTRKYLRISDDDAGATKTVYGLGRGYINFTANAPRLAAGHRAKALMLRMIAPEAARPDSVQDQFYALAWPSGDISPATALAATLEHYAPFPIQIGWGEYLLQQAMEQYDAEPLINGGQCPDGYVLKADTPWVDIISQGLKNETIFLDGQHT
ncbi:MAG: hypothetical protein U9Q82_03270 [Chloroflexota bacterium]|nr:hypothetical protein [Chloroflexota bacterium]